MFCLTPRQRPLRSLWAVLFVIVAQFSHADTVCTLVYTLETNTFLLQEGDCEQALSPASTFKIPLSLMAYDSGYLTDLDLPTLPYRSSYAATIPSHQQATSPRNWMKNSVVWYSQAFTEWLGAQRFKDYVAAFAYGNQDLSGEPGANNGLTRAWLSSSLKITPLQQVQFLQKMLERQLPVKDAAYDYTQQLLKQEAPLLNFSVYGKTGSVTAPVDAQGVKLAGRQLGWFVGWLQQDEQRIIFVQVINEPKQEGVYSGPKAKEAILGKLATLLRTQESQ